METLSDASEEKHIEESKCKVPVINGWMLFLIGKGMKRSISMALTLVKNIKYCMAKVTRVPNSIDDDDIGVNEVKCMALHVIGEDSVDEEERKKESICDVWLCL